MSGVYGNGVFQDSAGTPFTGATASSDGLAGSVPQPNAGDQVKFLSGNGSWINLPSSYQIINSQGNALPQQNTLNFIGGTVTVTDDPTNNQTNVTIASAQPTAFPFADLSTDTTLAANMGYTIAGSGTLQLTLPATIPYGSIIEIVGTMQANWQVNQNAGQMIIFSKSTTTTGTGGYANSTLNSDCIRLVCIKANTTFAITSAVGTINIT